MDAGRWRDQQLNSVTSFDSDEIVLEQEMLLLDFVTDKQNVVWRWHAPDSKFKKICAKRIRLSDTDYNGVIFFGFPNCNTETLIRAIRLAIESVDFAYVGINRYQVRTHNLPIDLPDSIEQSLDCLLEHCHPKFKRLHTFPEVDGNHLVFSHPMDCYGLCK